MRGSPSPSDCSVIIFLIYSNVPVIDLYGRCMSVSITTSAYSSIGGQEIGSYGFSLADIGSCPHWVLNRPPGGGRRHLSAGNTETNRSSRCSRRSRHCNRTKQGSDCDHSLPPITIKNERGRKR